MPNSTRINRGNYVMTELADACRANQMTDLMVVHEHRGVPDALVLSHFPHGPTVLFTLTGVVLRHSLGGLQGTTISEAYPQCVVASSPSSSSARLTLPPLPPLRSLIFEGFGSKLGKRVQDVLKYIFPVPKCVSPPPLSLAPHGPPLARSLELTLHPFTAPAERTPSAL